MLKSLDEQARKDVTRAGGALKKPLTREELVDWSSSASSSSSSSFSSSKDRDGRRHSLSPSSSSQAKSSAAGAGGSSSRATSVQYLAVEDDGASVAASSGRLMDGVDSAVAALLGSLSALENSSVTLLCLGSLTTIAGALETDAEMMRNKVRGMVIMGGSLYGANAASEDSAYHTQGGAEFNFYYHPQAVYDVLQSGLDITLIGLDVANAEAVSKDNVLYLAHETEVTTQFLDSGLTTAFSSRASRGLSRDALAERSSMSRVALVERRGLSRDAPDTRSSMSRVALFEGRGPPRDAPDTSCTSLSDSHLIVFLYLFRANPSARVCFDV